MTGFLDTQSAFNQDEAIYIGYFDRAADGAGLKYWVSQAPTLSMTDIANSFAVQPEASSLPTDPAAFIQAVYQNLFSRTADAEGLAYWQGQLQSGAVSMGVAVIAIANGALGNDQIALANKIQAATDFTTLTDDANLGTTIPLTQDFLTHAHNAVTDVLNSTSEQASEQATLDYVHGSNQGQTVGATEVALTGFLDTQTIANEDEALYIGYFNRAADGPGLQYWSGQTATLTQVANSFAVQPEAASLPTDPTAFIQAVYENLFSRQADADGLAYWKGQITSGAMSEGAAVVAIANGATGNDQTVLANKIQAAFFFTAQTDAANLGTKQPLDQTFVAAAHNAVGNVVDAGTEQSSEMATGWYLRTGGIQPVTEPTHSVEVVGQASEVPHRVGHG